MGKLIFKAVKVLDVNTGSNKPDIVAFKEPAIDSEAMALFNAKDTYSDIFGPKKKDSTQVKQRLSVIKISNGKRKIFRQYAGRAIPINKKSVGLSPNSWQQLCMDSSKDKEVVVCKSWWFPFFWNHSNSATRVSFRIGIIGLALAIVGIVVSIAL